DFSFQQVEYESSRIFFRFRTLPVYHKIKFWIADPDGLDIPGAEIRDVVHARAARVTRRGASVPGRFDTALVRIRAPDQDTAEQAQDGLANCSSVVRVRIIFKIPERGLADLFPHVAPESRPQHLAYVELFTELDIKGADHGFYTISPASNAEGERLAMIIPIEDFERSCQLIPHFGPVAPREWTCYDVLDRSTTLYLNSFADRNTYKLVL
ncbi:hypothetical protein BD309DRAFT_648961, partial [Dichomitus squalens]